jgi:hypothetical protein
MRRSWISRGLFDGMQAPFIGADDPGIGPDMDAHAAVMRKKPGFIGMFRTIAKRDDLYRFCHNPGSVAASG